jgi:phenylacetate-CoA ligase
MALVNVHIAPGPAERLSPETRRSRQNDWLARLVDHAYAHAPAVRATLDRAGLQPTSVRSVADLKHVPITRKDTLIDLQRAQPPFGGFLGVAEYELARVFMSPGPLFDPQGQQPDYWRFSTPLVAAGFSKDDLVLNACSHHLTPLGFMFDEAARAIGCRVIPSGVGNTELQVTVAVGLRATAYCGTPSFLKIIIDKAAEIGIAGPNRLALERAFVAGEMLPESLRAEIQTAGITVLQGYGTADLGCLGYECDALTGLHVPDEAILEIVDPATGQAVPAGQPGEVVATVDNPVYPLLRFGTGDLSLLDEAPCPCGRTSARLERIMGRVGDAVKVRGMFVHPRQLDEVLGRFPEVERYQAVVDRVDQHDSFVLRIAAGAQTAGLSERISEAVREILHVRADVELVSPRTIAEDGKKLVDQRTWT